MIEKYRLNNLHAIRGWAALLVVIAHAKYPFWSGGTAYLEEYPRNNWGILEYLIFAIDIFSSNAGIFVIIFFILSGFFIARSLELKSYNPLFFYGDRIIRIYIPVLGSLLIGYLAFKLSYIFNPDLFQLISNRPYNSNIIEGYNNLNFNNFLSSLFFVPGTNNMYFANNYPYWSLYYEAIFYIFIPFILIYLKRYFLTLSIIGFVTSFYYYSGWMTFLSFFMEFMIYFAVGTSVYQLTKNKNSRKIIIYTTRKYTNYFILSSLVLIIISSPIGTIGFKNLANILTMIGTIILILWILFSSKTKVQKISYKLIINSFSHFLGKISFSIYLIHVPLFVFMYSILNLYTGEIIYYERIYWIPVLIMLPISYIFYLVFEKNSLILLKKYKTKFGKKRS